MCSARDNAALPTLGFPIRASAGQRLFSASPRLIAAVHALHRLLVPRHPPCALNILTVIRSGSGPDPVIPIILAARAEACAARCATLCSFQGSPRGLERTATALGGAAADRSVSQNSTAWTTRERVA